MIAALNLTDIWTPTGILLGFQVTLFSWRLNEEARVGDKGSIPWLIPSDYLNLLAMLLLVAGVYLLPMSGFFTATQAGVFCGLGALLFVGYLFCLAGHYQLFNLTKKRVFLWFPIQERVAITLTLLTAATYLYFALPPLAGSTPAEGAQAAPQAQGTKP